MQCCLGSQSQFPNQLRNGCHYFFFQIQFTTALILGINGIRSGCEFPLWMQYMLVIYMISFIVLFGNFYAQAYIQKEKVKNKKKLPNAKFFLIINFVLFSAKIFKKQRSQTNGIDRRRKSK